jgi:hypothetical protein
MFVMVTLILCLRVPAADFTVTTPSFAYTITDSTGQSLGNNNPALTVVRGRTYTFAINADGSHPFRINAPGAPAATSSGTVTWTVPINAVNYSYVCVNHGFMTATITTIAPPTPPVPSIVNYSFGNSIVLRSAPGTNTFTITPEYKTNLNNSNWVALTVQSNRFINGTNETFCGRPPGDNVFIRVRVN